MPSKAYAIDLGERVIATAAAAGLGYAIDQLTGASGAWVPLIVVGLTAVKGILAKFVGDKDSAGLK